MSGPNRHSVTISVRLHKADVASSNTRLHWAKRAEINRRVRMHGWAAGRRRLAGRMIDAPLISWPVGVVVRISAPDRRRRDTHNHAPTVKALLDGLVDAGVLMDDSDQFIKGVDYRPHTPTGNEFWWFVFDLIPAEW